MMRYTASAFLAVVVGLAGCGDGGPTGPGDAPEDSTGVSIDLTPTRNIFFRVGESLTLQPVLLNAVGDTVSGSQPFEFSSSAPEVVHVSEEGVVAANWPGSAEIEVSLDELSAAAPFFIEIEGPEGGPVLGGTVACTGGTAAGFPCKGMDLVSYMPLPGLGAPQGVRLNDMWGWTDPETSRDYALVGRTDGLTFVDVTDPENPRAVGHLPAARPASIWRDVKVYKNHAYVVADGAPGHGIQIFDLTRLRGVDVFTIFTEDARYTKVSSVHNIAINVETGYAYAVGSGGGGMTCGGGLHMIDLSEPEAPTFAGCFRDPSTGRRRTGYTHDVQCVVYHGPDTVYKEHEICFGSNETAISIADVTDKENPVAISVATYPDAFYVHQGWLTEDHKYFIQNDELDERDGNFSGTRMLIWDVTELGDPQLAAEHLGPTGATDHNVYIEDGIAYQSNYHFGIRIVDISNPENPEELGYFDTHPPDNHPGTNGGSWSNYPFFDSDIVVVTSAEEGLFILRAR